MDTKPTTNYKYNFFPGIDYSNLLIRIVQIVCMKPKICIKNVYSVMYILFIEVVFIYISRAPRTKNADIGSTDEQKI